MIRQKSLAVLLVILLCLQLCACGGKDSTSENAAQEDAASDKEILTYGAVVIAPEVKQAII